MNKYKIMEKKKKRIEKRREEMVVLQEQIRNMETIVNQFRDFKNLNSESCGSEFSKDDIVDVMVGRLNEFAERVKTTSISTFYKRTLDLFRATKRYRKLVQANIETNTMYEQILLPRNIDFGFWLNIVLKSSLGDYFNSLNLVIDTGLSEHEEFSDQIETWDRGDIESCNLIYYNKVERNIIVVYNKKYISVTFINEQWNEHDELTPAFSVLKKYYLNSQRSGNIMTLKKEFKLDETIYKDSKSSKNVIYNDLLLKVCEFWGLTKEEYLSLTISYNPSTYIDNNGELRIVTEFDRSCVKIGAVQNNLINHKIGAVYNHSINKVFHDSGEIIIDKETPISEIHRIGLMKWPNSVKHSWPTSQLPIGSLFFCGCNTDNNFEDLLTDLMQKGFIPNEVFIFYCHIAYAGKPVYVYNSEEKVETSTYDLDYDWEQVGGNLILKEDESLFNEDYFYTFSQQKKGDILFGHKIEGKITIEDFRIGKMNAKPLLEKLKTECLDQDEKKYLSYFYGYINRNSSKFATIRPRELFESISRMPFSKTRTLICDMLYYRFGDLANLVGSLATFLYQIELSDNGKKALYETGFLRVRTDNWVTTFKNLSDEVKNFRHAFNYEMGYLDFKNLQYIDMFVGNLGDPGRTTLEIAKPRTTPVIEKVLPNCVLSSELEMDDAQMARNLHKSFCYNYSKKVVEKAIKACRRRERRKGNKGVNFKGFMRSMHERNTFATPSSTGGCKSSFSNKDRYATYLAEQELKNLKFGDDTKLGAFESERTTFWIRCVYDPPLCIANASLKRKELAKIRYIHAVWMPHYLLSSFVIQPFDEFLNQMGVNVNIDDLAAVAESIENKWLTYCCIDYQEFNEQHLEYDRQVFWSTFFEVLEENNLKNIGDFQIALNWMASANGNMIYRVNEDPNVWHKSKGRLFSGERATTLSNSVQSVSYLMLNVVATEALLLVESGQYKMSNRWLEIKKLIVNYKNPLPSWLLDFLYNNKSLGDDSIFMVPSIRYAHRFNEMAILCGLLLKLDKCLVGVGISEYLRKIQLKSKDKIFAEKGYANRTIASMVAGNVEGKIDKWWSSTITEFHSTLNVLYNRSNRTDFLNELLQAYSERCLALTKKVRQISTTMGIKQKMDYRMVFVPKKKGGLGLSTIGENKIFLIKGFIPNFTREKNEIVKKPFPLYASQAIIEKNVAEMSEYGKMNSLRVQMERLKQTNSIVESHTSGKILYTDSYIELYLKSVLRVNKIISGGNFIAFREYIKTDQTNILWLENLIRDNFNMKTLLAANVVGYSKKIQALEMKLAIIDLYPGVTKRKVIENELGKVAFWVYELGVNMNYPNILPQYFEIGSFYTLIGAFIVKLRYKGNIDDIVIAVSNIVQEKISLR